jgi:hypothetical protein
MSSRGLLMFVACLAVVAVFLAACGGGAKEKAETAPAPAGDTPATAGNDPAEAPAPSGPAPAASPTYDPATAAGAVKGTPAPTNMSQIEAVANFFTEVPGFDLAPLDARQRERFLHRANSEMCTCGCKNETLAWCLVNDPKCPVVKGLVQTVYDEVRNSR